MANLYARIFADGTHVSRQANAEVMTTVETWSEKVTVNLMADGAVIVRRGPKKGTGEIVYADHLETGAKP
jgi:hypothetical protein